MNGRKIYLFILICMALLVALGVWALVEATISYRHGPRIHLPPDKTWRQAAIHARHRVCVQTPDSPAAFVKASSIWDPSGGKEGK